MSMCGETHSYLTDDCELIADSGRRYLRLADANALAVPRTYARLRDREFFGGGTESMEQSSHHTAKTVHLICAVQCNNF